MGEKEIELKRKTLIMSDLSKITVSQYTKETLTN